MGNMKKTDKQLIYLFLTLFIILFSNTTTVVGRTQKEVKDPIVINMETSASLNRTDFDTSINYATNPLIYTESVYENLVIEDWKNPGTFVGNLAKDWAISQDGLVYTFNLKHGIKYQDNSPFNAYTMKYSFDKMILINDAYGPAYLLDEYIVGGPELLTMKDLNVTQANEFLSAGGVISLDEYTLQISLVKPFPSFISLLATYPSAISPYSLITNMPSNYTTNQNDDLFGMVSLADEFPNLNDWTKLGLASNHNPAISGLVPQADQFKASYNPWPGRHIVGTGPYQLVNNTVDEVKFIKYTNWHGQFAINSPDVVKYIYEPDGGVQDIHFRLGETDIYYMFYVQAGDYLDQNGVSIVPNITSHIIPVISIQNINFNLNENITNAVVPAFDIASTWNLSHIQNDNLVRYSNNNTFLASLENPFTALKFRKAFSLSFDYNTFINNIYGSHLVANRAEGMIPRGMWGHQDNLIEKGFVPEFDLVEAKQLFQEVGWRGNITLYHNTSAKIREDANKLLKSTIESLNVGININFVNVSWIDFFVNMSKEPTNLNGWAPDYNDAYNMFYPFYQSDGLYASNDNYNNSQMDNLLAQLKSEYDQTTRLNLIKQIEVLGASDYNCMYLLSRNKIILTQNWITGFESSGSAFSSYWAIRFQYLSKTVETRTTSPITSTTTDSGPIPGFEWFALVSIAFISIKLKNNHKKYKII